MGNGKTDNRISETWMEFINKFPMCNKKCTQCYSNALYVKGFFLYHIEDFTDEQLNFLIEEIRDYINRRAIINKKLDKMFSHEQNKTT